MAISDFRIPSATSDLVAVFDDGGNQLFGLARPIKVTTDNNIQYMQNPIEDGSNITDHSIILPDRVSIDFIITNFNYRDVYREMRGSARASQAFTVQTKSETFENMVIESYPSEEDPDKFDSIVVSLVFREIQFDTAQLQALPPSSVRNPADASTVDRGEQSTTETEASVAVQAARSIGFGL